MDEDTPVETHETDSDSRSESTDARVEGLLELLDQSATDVGQPGTVESCHRLTEQLVVTQDPERFLLSETAETHRGLNVYSDAPPSQVPVSRSFISGTHAGSVSTKEELCRTLRSNTTTPILIGDAGTGKNTSIDSLYSTLNQPVYRQQMGSGLSVFDVFAETELRDGNTVTTLKPFGLAAVFGGLAVIDEINLADQRLIANLNSMVEERGKRQLALPGTGVTLRDLPESQTWDPDVHLGKYLHPEFRVAATRNPPSYTGADTLNNALNDRFSPIRYQYPSVEREATLLSEKTNVRESDLTPLIEAIDMVREARRNNSGPRCPVSHRRLLDAVEYATSHGTTVYHAAVEKIAGYAQSEADRDFIESTLRDHKTALDTMLVQKTERSTENSRETGTDIDSSSVQCEVCGDIDVKSVQTNFCGRCTIGQDTQSEDNNSNKNSGKLHYSEEIDVLFGTSSDDDSDEQQSSSFIFSDEKTDYSTEYQIYR